MRNIDAAVKAMARRIAEILEPCSPSVYLYGSLALADFRPGWSDIDILVLTGESISEVQAKRLVELRREMTEEEPDNSCYRLFEGGMLTLDSLITGAPDRVVYWGTSGERITDRYLFDAFCRCELLDCGILLCGRDVREHIERPGFDELRENVRRHYETIRKYARTTGRSLYSFGWLLDISRCIYTLRTGKIIAKTAAGEWALREGLCPCADSLTKAVEVRKSPETLSSRLLDYAGTLGGDIQRYADLLELELSR